MEAATVKERYGNTRGPPSPRSIGIAEGRLAEFARIPYLHDSTRGSQASLRGRAKIDAGDSAYSGHRICAVGRVGNLVGNPQPIVNRPGRTSTRALSYSAISPR